MIKVSLKRGSRLTLLTWTLLLFGGFCLITNSAGVRRTYLDSAIPFTYRLNESIPASYVPGIEASHQTWNNVAGSYWLFQRGPNSTATSVSNDGVNLVFFDLAGVNFPPPSSTIAFSSTFTSTVGGFHATESDLIWNARDFPPSPSGAPGQQDLQSVMTHEFGHHLGLDHTGLPGGASSGCGPLVQAATMWWSSSSGDTTKRSLHTEDIVGVSVLYPVWQLQGTVTGPGGSLVANFPVVFRGTAASVVGPVENPIGNRFNRSGYVLDTIRSDANGQYATIVVNQEFDIVTRGFGYVSDSSHIQFAPPGGIGQTQTIVQNFSVQQTPLATISGFIRNANTSAPIQARVQFFGFGDPNGLSASVSTQTDGSYTANLRSAEAYRIVVEPAAPYHDQIEVDSTFLPSIGSTISFDLLPAQILIVDDDAGSSLQTAYQQSVDRLGFRRRTISLADSGGTLDAVLASFTQKPVIVWFTGQDSANAMTQSEKLSIINHLSGGGRAIITGQNIAEFAPPGDTLLNRYLGIQFVGNTTSSVVRGFVGDIIGNGINYFAVGGPGPQPSKDVINIIPGSLGSPTPTLYYSGADSSSFASVRVAGPGNSWSVVYFAFGLDGMIAVRQDTLLARSLRYFDTVTGVEAHENEERPEVFSLDQNYPNPFNPTTRIRFGLPQKSNVRVTVYNIVGQEVARVHEGEHEAGFHTVIWNGMNNGGVPASSGIYFYKLEATGTNTTGITLSRKMILLK